MLCIKRVKDFEEGVNLINSNPYANGAVIFTQNGYYSREFVKRIHGGMVGVNVGIPVPVGIFPLQDIRILSSETFMRWVKTE